MALVLTSSVSVNGCPWSTIPSLVNARPRRITRNEDASAGSPYLLNLRQRGIPQSTSRANCKFLRATRRECICRAQMSIIPADSGKALFCVLAASAAFAQVMEDNTKWGSFVSAPLIAMGASMILSGIQFIPVSAQAYDFVFTLIMPMAVSLSLLEIDVKQAFSNAGITLKAFWLGALGTVLGTIISFKIVGHALGLEGWKIASCLCASYIGGSINYAATAQALGLTSPSTLAAGMAADNFVMAGYFAFIFSLHEKSIGDLHIEDKSEDSSMSNRDVEFSVESISVSLAAAAVACTAGDAIARLLPVPFAGSSLAIMAIITSLFSSTVAQLSGVSEHTSIHCFAGAQKIGAAFMLLFFSVVAETRFASHTIVLRRLVRVKEALCQMVISNKWGGWKQVDTEKAKIVKDLIFSDDFWNRVEYALELTEPLMSMLRYADTDEPCLGHIYDAMDSMLERMKLVIQRREQDLDTLYSTVEKIVLHCWNKMTTPLHLLAYALSPRYYSSEILDIPGRVPPYRDPEVAARYKRALNKLFSDLDVASNVRREFVDFVSGKFAEPDVINDQSRLDAIGRWYLHGERYMYLQPLAIKILSQIGASTSIKEAISGGGPLFVFISLLIFIHLIVILFIGHWLKFPLRAILVASNANIGGPATAAAMANSRNWKELVQPAILVGTLGYTIGTAVGCLVGLRFLRPMQ